VPIIVISAKGQEIDKVLGLELGADDYVTKPFGIREILARARAVLRRSRRPLRKMETAAFGEVKVDFLRLEVLRGEKRTRMSNYEAQILQHLLTREGEVVPRADLLRDIWGADCYAGDRTVGNYVAKLRRKVEKEPRDPRHIITVHGVGYRFAP
jgi:DNA-binding response OmpR family regulator